jgi:hypothetical protein
MNVQICKKQWQLELRKHCECPSCLPLIDTGRDEMKAKPRFNVTGSIGEFILFRRRAAVRRALLLDRQSGLQPNLPDYMDTYHLAQIDNIRILDELFHLQAR